MGAADPHAARPGEPDAFEAHRGLLRAIAYRMLGSAVEADDVVQEAWLRWQAAPRDAVDSPRAFLSTVVTRLCLDQLKSARARRESYVGPWLPEPVSDADGFDPESLSTAFLVLLESLSPLERAVYLLRQAFDYEHGEIAAMLDRDEAAVRQVFHRAREHVRARRPRFAPSRADHERLLVTFLAACQAGDLDALRGLLAADAVAYSDGGGRVTAATKPVRGADNVARLFAGLTRRAAADVSYALADVNGAPALVLRRDGAVVMVLGVETDGVVIHAVHTVVNPDKLARVRPAEPGGAGGDGPG